MKKYIEQENWQKESFKLLKAIRSVLPSARGVWPDYYILLRKFQNIDMLFIDNKSIDLTTVESLRSDIMIFLLKYN